MHVLSSLPSDVPVLAGMEARVATRRGTRVRRLTEKAALALSDDTAKSSTSAGGSGALPRMKERRTPRVPQEGGSVQEDSTSKPSTSDNAVSPDAATMVDENERATHNDMLDKPDTQDVLNASLLTQSSLGIDLLSEIRGKYSNDPFFRVILEQPKEFRNFEEDDQFIFLKEHDKRVLCIPKILVQGRNAREIVISEAHSMLAHLGPSKTVDYLRDYLAPDNPTKHLLLEGEHDSVSPSNKR